MAENIKVTCDNCKTEFPIKIKSKKVGIYKGENVRFNYFACNSCKMKYYSGVKEKQLDKLVAKLVKCRAQIRSLINMDTIDKDAIEKLQNDSVRLQSEVKAMSEMLKSMFVLK